MLWIHEKKPNPIEVALKKAKKRIEFLETTLIDIARTEYSTIGSDEYCLKKMTGELK